MAVLVPESVEQLAFTLKDAAQTGKTVGLIGASSKSGMAGPQAPSGFCVSTTGLRKVVSYDSRDLTISVEAGLPYRELAAVLAEKRQMLPLDPPFLDRATVGGVVATNSSGPSRRLYGTARDMIIGMHFATMEGKVVQSGGMVVKNVAGLDMAKLMVGSFGTLAGIAVVNFKVVPMPPATRTFVMQFPTPEALFAARDAILSSVLQPTAVDALNPAGAKRVGWSDWLLLVQASGSDAVLNRYHSELPESQRIEGPAETDLWERIREFVPHYLAAERRAVVIRVSSTISEVKAVLASSNSPALARAANGVCYLCFPNPKEAAEWMKRPESQPWKSVVEFAPEDAKAGMTLWPAPGSDFAMMEKVKDMFDPARLLNRGRLYGRI